jgi:hypothetical protein
MNPENLAKMGDMDLWELAALVRAEQSRRLREVADPATLTSEAFSSGFNSQGQALEPVVVSGMIVCPGSRIDKSASSHDCSFVKIDDEWVWDSPDLVSDDVRTAAERRVHMRSVSLVPAIEGTKVDFISSKCKSGVHEMRKCVSFEIIDGALSQVSARTVSKSSTHR